MNTFYLPNVPEHFEARYTAFSRGLLTACETITLLIADGRISIDEAFNVVKTWDRMTHIVSFDGERELKAFKALNIAHRDDPSRVGRVILEERPTLKQLRLIESI